MARKRKQYYISQFNFKDIEDEKGILSFHESYKVEYPNSENLLYDLIYRLVDRKYDASIDENGKKVKNTIPEMFILKSKGINEEDEKEVSRYETLVKDGVYINDIKYVYSQKSSSMIRTQKTVYVQESIKDMLEEYITLGVIPSKTVMAKWLSNKGLLMSTAHLMPGIPKIVVIPDFERIVIDDVKMVLEYELTEQDRTDNKELIEEEKVEKARYKEYREKHSEVKELFTQDYLRKNFTVANGYSSYQTAYNWTVDDKRVKIEELDKPKFLRRNKQDEVFPIYNEEQTEDIKTFPVTRELLGYETKVVKDNENEINCFDGMGLVSLDYMEKIEDFLEIKNTNAIQGRLPYVKGLFIKFDFKKYIKKELNMCEIVDLWGDTHKIDDIDILVTESCLKAKIELDEEGKGHWLFKNMEDYYNRLDKYGYKYFGISNYANDRLSKYAPTTYQLINALDLTYKDLRVLARPEVRLIKNVIRTGDTASVKLFLDMISSRDSEDGDAGDKDDTKTKIDYIKDAIELNERMVFDKEVQKTLFELAESSIYEIMRGRIRIPSRYQYITGDIIGFCEWAAYREPDKVKGFLGKNEFCCKGMENEEYMLARYPLTHYSEIKVAPFIRSNNKYIKHLHNIIQLNMYDLSMPQLAGADLDGDSVDVIFMDTPLSDGKTIGDAVIKDYVIVNPTDGALAKEDEINIDTILEFEKANLHNLTGAVTNINTTICDKAVVRDGQLIDEDLAISVLKHKQGEIIDSAKTGQVVTIPELLVNNNPKLPYFFKYIYGGNTCQYLYPNSPLSRLTLSLEKWMRSSKIFLYQDTIGTEIEDKSYLDMVKIHNLMINDDKFDTSTYFKLHDALTPIHNDFSTRRGDIYMLSKDIDKFNRNEDTKEQRKIISSMYAELYEETKNKAVMACTEVCGSYNPSILASVATRIAYEDSKTGSNGISSNKNYLFGWIVAPEGVIENVKKHEDFNKTKLTKINIPKEVFDLDNFKVLDSIATTSKNISFPTFLENGGYSLLHKNGKYYAVSSVEEEFNIETTNSRCIGSDGIELLKDYPATVGFLQRDKEEFQEIFNSNKVRIDIEKGEYLSLFLENEFLCSFTKDCIINKGHRVDLNRYIGQDVRATITKLNKKSIDIMLVS